ncbi:hypothetical protein [Candidatus Poriferisodalis sp.]|uniref:hypothetical protein n=1 Tax=Candidatus Poriferisodalis sp. TaxID=3101277 RepID=UPI003B02813A
MRTQRLLARLAPKFGGRAATVHEALQRLAADQDRKESHSAFLEAWEAQDGSLTEDEVSAMAKCYGL